MNLAYLKASRLNWIRSERWAKARHAAAIKAHDQTHVKKWSARLHECRTMIAKRDRQIAAKRPKASARGRALAWASARVGITESPSGSNGNPANISRWQAAFGFGRVPWCGVFCGTALRQAGVQGVTSRIAAVSLIEDDARAHRGPFRGWTTGRAGVMRGDLAVIGGRGVHVELVEKVLANGALQTIGGNTSSGPSGSQSNGGGCFRRTRSAHEIYGCALVQYPNR